MNTQSSYDAVADEYVARVYDELRHKPLDQEILRQFAAAVGNEGPVCDVGCGPGQVARFLHETGLRVCGIDLSSEMVAQALRLNPGVEFEQGDMRGLNRTDGFYAGITAFYSLIHIAPDEMVPTLRELHRVLRTDGLLLVAFHLGNETLHLDEWWGRQVTVDFHFYPLDEMTRWLEQSGFEIVEITEREPYPDVEHSSRRGYVLSRARPSTPRPA